MFRLFSFACLLFFLSATTISADEPTIGDYTTFWRPLVGSWKATLDVDGDVSTGTFKFRISPNKKCAVLYHGFEGEPFVQQLQGYDPEAKKIVAYGFLENGDRWIQTFDIEGMEKGMKAKQGAGGNWEQKVLVADGTTKGTTSQWSFLVVEDNKIVMQWANIEGREDGRKKSTMTLEREE